MAIDSISGSSAIMEPSALSRMRRPPEAAPDAVQQAAQENDARRTAESVRGSAPARLAGPDEANASTGTRVNVLPASNSSEGSLQTASSEISRSNAPSGPTPAEMRAASEAYQAQASARDQAAQQQRQGGVRSTDILA